MGGAPRGHTKIVIVCPATPATKHDALVATLGEDYADALIAADPEVDLERVGRRFLPAARVFESNYSEANSRGALFQPVRPERVVEIKISDVQADTSGGDPVTRMVLAYEDGAWTARQRMHGVSILHPRLLRMRDDKQAVEGDIPVRQVFERVLVGDADAAPTTEDLPKSEVLRREVFTKASKGKTAVRKLLVWKTNKHEADPTYPAYVVHFTDYSPSRKDPLKRTVRLAPDADAATEIAQDMLESEIKKGWKPA